MDEPTRAIDPVATAKIEDLIESSRSGTRSSSSRITCSRRRACRDFTAFFYEGRIVEFGPTEQIFTKPTQKQTEDYITGRFG